MPTVFDQDVLHGKWLQLKGRVKEKWSQLTDDDISEIEGRREYLEGKIRERYGYDKQRAKEEVDRWLDEHRS